MVCPYSHLADESSISLKNEIYIDDPATVINATLLIPPPPRPTRASRSTRMMDDGPRDDQVACRGHVDDARASERRLKGLNAVEKQKRV